METAEISKNLWGDELYQQRARKAFPILVRQAIVGEPIFYSDLAEEMGMPNERNLNYVLGCIGKTLVELSEQKATRIPPIQCLVVNKATRLPGEGIAWFIPKEDFKKLDNKQRRQVINTLLSEIYAYPMWKALLVELGLEQPTFPEKDFKQNRRFGGEGDAHRRLKEYVANNPSLVGLPKNCPAGKTEYPLDSGDSVDVCFFWRDKIVAVEVKSHISEEGDINRGLFQCVKYQAVLEAMMGVKGKPRNAETKLVLESSLPTTLLSTKNMLGIDVLSNVKIIG